MHNILARIVEVKTTTDAKEAALLLQAGNWFAFGAAFKGEEIEWALGRVTTPQSQVDQVRGILDAGAAGSRHTRP